MRSVRTLAIEPVRKNSSVDCDWEMVSAEAFLHQHNRTTREMLYFAPEERPIICQLMGSDAARLAEAAKRIEDWGFDGVDLNMGCPAQKIYGNRCGSSLLDYPDEAAEIVYAMKYNPW